MNTIFQKIIFAFLLIIAIITITASYEYFSMRQIESTLKEIEQFNYPIDDYSKKLARGTYISWIGIFLYVQGDTSFGRQFVNEGQKIMLDNLNFLSEKGVDVDSLNLKTNNVIAEQQQILLLLKTHAGTDETIRFALNTLQQRSSALMLDTINTNEKYNNVLKKNINYASSQSRNFLLITLIIFIITTGVAVASAYFIALKISKPILILSKKVDSFSQGDYDIVIDTESDGEIGVLEESFKAMIKKIKDSHDAIEIQNIKLADETSKQKKLLDNMVGRELKMIELKKEITHIKKEIELGNGENK